MFEGGILTVASRHFDPFLSLGKNWRPRAAAARPAARPAVSPATADASHPTALCQPAAGGRRPAAAGGSTKRRLHNQSTSQVDSKYDVLY